MSRAPAAGSAVQAPAWGHSLGPWCWHADPRASGAWGMGGQAQRGGPELG